MLTVKSPSWDNLCKRVLGKDACVTHNRPEVRSRQRQTVRLESIVTNNL